MPSGQGLEPIRAPGSFSLSWLYRPRFKLASFLYPVDTRLSLDAIRVPGSVFYFACSLAFITMFLSPVDTSAESKSRTAGSFIYKLFVRVLGGCLFCE